MQLRTLTVSGGRAGEAVNRPGLWHYVVGSLWAMAWRRQGHLGKGPAWGRKRKDMPKAGPSGHQNSK